MDLSGEMDAALSAYDAAVLAVPALFGAICLAFVAIWLVLGVVIVRIEEA
jgi:hypothetical protein